MSKKKNDKTPMIVADIVGLLGGYYITTHYGLLNFLAGMPSIFGLDAGGLIGALVGLFLVRFVSSRYL